MTNDTDDEQNAAETWIDATERFIGGAPALSDVYAPQIKALRWIAAQLDGAGDPAPALVAEYSRIHRWLLNKLGGAKGDGDAGGPSLESMLPGVNWLE